MPHINYVWLGLLVAGFLALHLYDRSSPGRRARIARNKQEDAHAVAESISVNLGILRREIDVLTGIADGYKTDSLGSLTKVTEARRCLTSAGAVLSYGEGLQNASSEDLCARLRNVFRAMDQARRARFLLDAVQPYTGE